MFKVSLESKKNRFYEGKRICAMKEKILERLTCFKDRVDELGGYTSKIICKEVATENEWNTRGKVLAWDIKQFFHKDNQTIVEWHFKNKMNEGKVEEFDGISLIVWTVDNKIKALKEFGCNCNNYNPYKESETPLFRDEKANWF